MEQVKLLKFAEYREFLNESYKNLFPAIPGFAKKAAKYMKKEKAYTIDDVSKVLTSHGEVYLGKENLLAIGQELVDMGFDVKLDEALTKFNRGSLIKHELYPELNGTVKIGPDTYDNIQKAGYDMPEPENYEETIDKPVWYGIILTQNQKKGWNQF